MPTRVRNNWVPVPAITTGRQAPGYYGGWDPLRYDSALGDQGEIDTDAWLKLFGARHVGGGPVSDRVEMDCLLCHSDLTGQRERGLALQQGDFEWANSLAFSQRDILLLGDEGWQWNPAMFQADGSLTKGLLDIRKPRDENCAQCHGQVDNSLDNPLTITADLSGRSMTDRTGQIFSPQKLSNSGLNLADKESLNHAFDVHSDRVVACVNCHYSLNNPVYFQQREESRPVHLDFDPRRLTSADYLERPLHQFAKGKSILGLAAAGAKTVYVAASPATMPAPYATGCRTRKHISTHCPVSHAISPSFTDPPCSHWTGHWWTVTVSRSVNTAM